MTSFCISWIIAGLIVGIINIISCIVENKIIRIGDIYWSIIFVAGGYIVMIIAIFCWVDLHIDDISSHEDIVIWKKKD